MDVSKLFELLQKTFFLSKIFFPIDNTKIIISYLTSISNLQQFYMHSCSHSVIVQTQRMNHVVIFKGAIAKSVLITKN